MQNRNILFIVIFCISLVMAGAFFFMGIAMLWWTDTDVAFGESIAVVDIKGEINYDRSKLDELETYRDDDDVRAVVLFINSGGGGVAASQALHHAVASVREKKPVVAFMASIAASGGYYVACGADSILAHEGTLTGSIGVVASFLRTEALFEKVGLDVRVIKAGDYKDVGSPHREMTQEERAYLENLLDGVYIQFIQAVSRGRGMTYEEVAELAEGRLYSGGEAAAVGLIDRVGTYEEAIQTAARMAGLDEAPTVIRRERRRPLVERLLGRAVSVLPREYSQSVRLEYRVP